MKRSPRIIVGCMSWGAWGKRLSDSEKSQLIEFCVGQGNSVFDHADIYGDYTTEEEFGKALAQSQVNRNEVELITKCGIQYKGKTRDNRIKHYDYSKEYIIRSAEESLQKLRTDYLDLFLLHRPSPLMNPEEIAESITHLKQSGKIKGFGVSNFTPSQLSMLANWLPIEANQIEFSLTQHSIMYDGTLDHMMKEGISAMSWSPLGIVYKEKSDQVGRIKSVLESLSQKYEVPEEVLLLSWIVQHPVQASPVIGTTNPERIKNANRALDLRLEKQDWFSLLEASQGHGVP